MTDVPPRDALLEKLSRASTADLLAWRDAVVARAAEAMAHGRQQEAMTALRDLELLTVDAQTLAATDGLLRGLAGDRRIVASWDPRRVPGADEVVIIYGNYPHAFYNVVVNNPVKRHVADFWTFRHDVVEYDQRWGWIEQVYVINADERVDRYDATLRELAAARAPFDRLTRIPAQMVSRDEFGAAAGQIGCMTSHLAALRHARERGYAHVLVLEDDFTFTSDLQQHLGDLAAFGQRQYDYWICLVATSKYGPVVPHDDLVAQTFQVCTNTGGYLISASGIGQLIPVYEEALEQMRRTGVTVPWAVDRCWAVLQPSGRFLVFRRKFGFQTSSFSDIERSISRYLD